MSLHDGNLPHAAEAGSSGSVSPLSRERTAEGKKRAAVPPPLSAVRQELERCINCGYCLQACPTYEVSLTETASPRGRIQLLKAVTEERAELQDGVDEALDTCLGCRACETACPVNVEYGTIFNAAREAIETDRTNAEEDRGRAGRSRLQTTVTRILLRRLIPSRRLMGGGRFLLWAAQYTGLIGLANSIPVLKQRFQAALHIARSLPRLGSPFAPRWPSTTRRGSSGTRSNRSAFLFAGCVQEAVAPRTNRATARLLQGAGIGVDVPRGQTCCGALHAHIGDTEAARRLARANILAFERYLQSHPDAVLVSNAGGCGAMLKEYAHLFARESEWEERARAFSERVRDLSEVLTEAHQPSASSVKGETTDVKERLLRVTYQDSCHLCHGQGVHAEPRDLLQSLPGVEYVEMPGADRCCGSAGIYNLLQPSWSTDILDQKMKAIAQIQPDAIVTSNPGCYFQMKWGTARASLNDHVQVIPLPEFLAQYDKC